MTRPAVAVLTDCGDTAAFDTLRSAPLPFATIPFLAAPADVLTAADFVTAAFLGPAAPAAFDVEVCAPLAATLPWARRLTPPVLVPLTPAVDALTILAVAALAAAFLPDEAFTAAFEEEALETLLDPFDLMEDFCLAADVPTPALLEVFCANAPSTCAMPPSNTAPSNSLDIQFTTPISAKTSHSRDGF
ncbi:MAG: hypothetical protein Q4D91_01775 [Lautropia sp.]|nr:hypothetical protein [Lautropia sp.]